MSADLKPKLAALLHDYAANGQGPFAARVKDRRVNPSQLPDHVLRAHLSMAYGALLSDLDRAGLSAFYVKDLSQVVGRERAYKVLAATEPRRPAPHRPMAKWKIWTAVVAVILIGLQINHYATLAIWRPRIAAMEMTSDAWLETYQSSDTPEGVREIMFKQAVARVTEIPVYSSLWLEIKLDRDLPRDVEDQMNDLSDAHSARLEAQEERRGAEARRRCMRLGDSGSRYECMGKLGVWRDVERTSRMMTGGDPNAPSNFPSFQ